MKGQIYIDGTISMDGFVAPDEPTYYTQLIPNLERAFVSGWTDAQVEFYKFGTEVRAISQEEYLLSDEKAFYRNPAIMMETHVQSAIEHSAAAGEKPERIFAYDRPLDRPFASLRVTFCCHSERSEESQRQV